MNDFTFYQILGISKNASTSEIKASYRNLASKFHPDKTNSALSDELMKKVNQAYEVLSDPKRRKEYDYTIGEKLSENTTKQTNNSNSKSSFWINLKKTSKIYGKQAQRMGKEIAKLIQNYQANSTPTKSSSKKSNEYTIHHYYHYENKKHVGKKQRSKKQEPNDYGFNIKDVFDL